MRKKIAIIHPRLGWGGSEATALWMIEALKNEYDVSLVTTGNVDVSGLNAYYGTGLYQKEFSVMYVPMPLGLRKTMKFAALRGRFIQRYCQKIASQFDVMIDAYSPCDFKTRGIQFATDIAQLPTIIDLSSVTMAWYGDTFLRKMYLALCDLVSPLHPEAWKNNVTISNSHWTADVMLKKYGISSRVLYPPVVGDSPNVPYEKKEQGFVLIGRIVPEKKITVAIEILEKVRQKGRNIKFHIIGGVGSHTYMRTLKPIFLKNKSWLFFEGRLSEENKKKIITSCQFGISCRKNEPFGIAVAEMVKSGSIVFVPDGGGQTEIVDNAALIYKDIEDAVQKIESVINNETLQNALREHLLKNAQKFSVDNFKREIKNIVDTFLKNNIK